MKTTRNKILRLALLSLALSHATNAFANADTLSGVEYDVLDRFGVNMASGQVQATQTTLSIGGAMGLNHTISSQTSDFANILGHGGGSPAVAGFGDENRGGLYSVVVYKPSGCTASHGCPWQWQYGLRVFGGGASEDFGLSTSGEWLPYKRPSSSSLEFVDDAEFTGYVMTTGDGARMYYPSSEITSLGSGDIIREPMSKIVYANGFTVDLATTISIDGSIYSVRTNTGFQLKYDFTDSWNHSSPSSVTALNNAIERCPHGEEACDLSPGNSWPYATYSWPINGPNNGNIVESLRPPSVFRVQDSEGRITDYHHESWEADLGPLAPRIVRIEKDGDVVMNYNYGFNPSEASIKSSSIHYFVYTRGVARVTSAWVDGGGSQGYSMHVPRMIQNGIQIGMFNQATPGVGRPSYVESSNFGALVQVVTWDQVVNFHYQLVSYQNEGMFHVQNYVTDVLQRTGDVRVEFQYDSRGNVTERTEAGITTRAHYPSTCTSHNFRYCNKPSWIEDANGNRTSFYYHAPSGEITYRVSPLDADGIQGRTYYEYDQYYAHYKIDSDTVEAADTPIWLVSRETRCLNSPMYPAGNCLGGDEIVTTYEYDHHNLFLIGIATTAENTEGEIETLRTCYEYDVYGNRIGETSPRANLASCQ